MRGLFGLFTAAACALAALAACGGSAGKSTPTASPTPSAVSTGGATSSVSASGSAGLSSPPASTPMPTQTGPLLTGHGVSPGELPPTRSTYSLPHTADGAIAFAAYFYKALDWSIATTDPYLLRQISAPTCGSCNTYINGIEKVEAAGGSSTGARITIESIGRVNDTLVPAEYVFQIELHQSAQVLIASVGAAPTTYPDTGSQDTNDLYIGWGPTGWWALEFTHS